MTTGRAVVLFVKAPIPGRVKTRLARDIGDQAACSIYQKLTEQALQQVLVSGFPLALFFAGNEEELPAGWKQQARYLVQQQGADLGERMAHAFRKLFTDGEAQVVLIGSDIPGLDAAYLQQAFRLLASHDLVIGPTEDGGYCLIGFNCDSFADSVFQQIPWSTDQVVRQTLMRCEQDGLKPVLLDMLRDIDTLDDLRQAAPELLQIVA